MNKFSNFVKHADAEYAAGGRRLPVWLLLHEALRCELERGILKKQALCDRLRTLKRTDPSGYKKLVKDEGFSLDECRDVLAALAADVKKCVGYELEESERNSCMGDDLLRGVFEGRRVDVLTAVNSVANPVLAWALADCKFEMKAPPCATVCDEDNFQHDVAEKFDEVVASLSEEREPVWKKRLVLVCSGAYGVLLRFVAQKRLGTKHPLISSDLYDLCSVDTVSQCLKRAENQYRTATRCGARPALVFGS